MHTGQFGRVRLTAGTDPGIAESGNATAQSLLVSGSIALRKQNTAFAWDREGAVLFSPFIFDNAAERPHAAYILSRHRPVTHRPGGRNSQGGGQDGIFEILLPLCTPDVRQHTRRCMDSPTDCKL